MSPSKTNLEAPFHGVAHMPVDLWRYGPCRGYWCFGFEAFNKVLKRGAQRGGYKNTCESIVEYWSILSARRMLERRDAYYRAQGAERRAARIK